MYPDLELLLTPGDLARATAPDGAGGPGTLDVEDAGAVAEARAAIAHAQEAVAGRLGYPPLVRAVRQLVVYPPYGPFDRVHPLGGPVAEVFTAGVTTDGARLYPTPAAVPYPPPAIDYAAGWRGDHHHVDPDALADDDALEDLRGLPGLAALTALPPALPGDVRSVLVEVAWLEYDRRRRSELGGRRTVVTVGEGRATSAGYRANAEAEALDRLSPRHRHVSV